MSATTQNILVICDSGFQNLCEGPEDYIARLREMVSTRTGGDYKLSTISGKYGLGATDATIPVLEIEDRNKTSFVQTIENMVDVVNELIIISVVDFDAHIEALAAALSERCITIRRHKYTRKS